MFDFLVLPVDASLTRLLLSGCHKVQFVRIILIVCINLIDIDINYMRIYYTFDQYEFQLPQCS